MEKLIRDWLILNRWLLCAPILRLRKVKGEPSPNYTRDELCRVVTRMGSTTYTWVVQCQQRFWDRIEGRNKRMTVHCKGMYNLHNIVLATPCACQVVRRMSSGFGRPSHQMSGVLATPVKVLQLQTKWEMKTKGWNMRVRSKGSTAMKVK
jgi:hypothetical protein